MLLEVKSGHIGDVQFVSVEFGVDVRASERITDLSLGGGVLADLGCYAVQLVRSIFQEYPEKITASGSLYHTGAYN